MKQIKLQTVKWFPSEITHLPDLTFIEFAIKCVRLEYVFIVSKSLPKQCFRIAYEFFSRAKKKKRIHLHTSVTQRFPIIVVPPVTPREYHVVQNAATSHDFPPWPMALSFFHPEARSVGRLSPIFPICLGELKEISQNRDVH